MQSAEATPRPDLSSVHKAYRFGLTVRNKQARNLKLVQQIDDYLATAGIELPDDKSECKRWQARIFEFERFGTVVYEDLEPLINFRYAIAKTKGYYAHFQAGPLEKSVPLAFWYSRHRLCHVWNWRKSQLIRNKYYNYLQQAVDETGRKLTDYYRPLHLTLTVPHRGGTWEGKRFYARELIAAFRDMRKHPMWKQFFYAGEYGVEVKRAADRRNGLHIHIHSFILQNPKYSINTVRAWLEEQWRRHTGNTTDYSGLHYETLYRWAVCSKSGKLRKDYIKPGDATEKYLGGVMECIKYHFEPNALETEAGSYDIALIQDILANTRNVRLYSRFGKFYKEAALNFNTLEGDTEEGIDTEAEPTGGDAMQAEARLRNPFTGNPAYRDEFDIVIAPPTAMRYRVRATGEVYGIDLPYRNEGVVFTPPSLPLSEIIRLDVTGKLRESIERFAYEVDTETHFSFNP